MPQFTNPGLGLVNIFDQFYDIKEAEKQGHLEEIQTSTAKFHQLNQLIEKFLQQPKDKPADFRSDPEAQALIDALKKDFHILDNPRTPYYYENSHDVVSYLMKRGNDLQQISNEHMLYLNQAAEMQKNLKEIIQIMLNELDREQQKYLELGRVHA